MKHVLTHEHVALIHGDAAELPTIMPPNFADALVCDPPAGIGFMGKAWDKDKGGRDQWIAWLTGIMRGAYTVMKPGAHGLVWALPRTSHWTAFALENAGFEIRDRVSHLFGTGFPKSLNVSKAIDKAAGAEREVIGFNQNARPNRVGKQGRTYGAATIGGEITMPATDDAQQWDGWGTALKPACEDWWLIRKPLIGTVAANVLEHGTGAINVDACRVNSGPSPSVDRRTNRAPGESVGATGWVTPARPPSYNDQRTGEQLGRWPANIVLDPIAAAALDHQAGPSKSTKGKPRKGKAGDGYGMTHTGAEYSDVGGPSRFFYIAKPNRKERDAGCDHLPPKSGSEATGRVDDSKGTQNPRAGAGRTGGARNYHPTVKSQALMAWLIRLITPPGGIVVDPFMGSGSTGIAAVSNGFEFVGIEREADFAEIAKARIDHALRALGS